MASYIVDMEAIVTVRVEAESESAAEEMAIEAVSRMDGTSTTARCSRGACWSC